MPRQPKCRRVCNMPLNCEFFPCDKSNAEIVNLTVDEYETIRLIDLENFTQDDCASRMEVARTTVQSIYENARRKLADAIVNGKKLVINGGEYRICGKCSSGTVHECLRQNCCKKEQIMKIAVTYDNGEVFQHFGHTETFKVYEIENNQVKSSKEITSTEGGHSALAGLLGKEGIDTLICGGIGGGAIMAMKELGVSVYAGVTGSADSAVENLLSGTLSFNPNPHCDHHDSHHTEGETCHSATGCNHKCH